MEKHIKRGFFIDYLLYSALFSSPGSNCHPEKVEKNK